jgi:hypothetical protein
MQESCCNVKKRGGINFTRVVKMQRSPKTGAYTFQEAIVDPEILRLFLRKKVIFFVS